MKVDFITGYNKKLWNDYAKYSTATWKFRAYHYKEGRGPRQKEWDKFREENRDVVGNGTFDNIWIPYSHKAQAQIEHILNVKDDVTHIVWIDSDVIQTKRFDDKWLEQILPHGDEMITYLGREKIKAPPETGFMAYNAKHPDIKEFALFWENIYFTKRVFDLKVWNDMGTIELAMNEKNPKKRSIAFKHTTSPFYDSPLKNFLMHLKGPRKDHTDKLVSGEWTPNDLDKWVDSLRKSLNR